MVQPQYSPEEALNRVKLMMSYDMSKTLNENKEEIGVIEEQAVSAGLQAVNYVVGESPSAKSIKKILSKCKSRLASTGTLDAGDIAGNFNKAFSYTIAYVPATDDELIETQLDIMSRGTMDDLCNIKKEFEDAGFGNFAETIIDELDDKEKSEVARVFLKMESSSRTSSQLTVKNEGRMTINWWREKFPCIFESNSNAGTQVYVNQNKYPYILFTGTSNRQYQLYQNGNVRKENGGQTGLKISCNGSIPKLVKESTKTKVLDENVDDSMVTGGAKKETPIDNTKTGNLKVAQGWIKDPTGNKTWEYQVRGCKWIARKIGTSTEYNISDNPKYSSSVQKLDAAYPNLLTGCKKSVKDSGEKYKNQFSQMRKDSEKLSNDKIKPDFKYVSNINTSNSSVVDVKQIQPEISGPVNTINPTDTNF